MILMTFVLCTTIELAAAQKKVSVYLIGTGVVGKALLEQIQNNHDLLAKRYGLDIRVVGIANSQKMCLNSKGINLSSWNDLRCEPMSLNRFFSKMLHTKEPNPVFVDCTSNQLIADLYGQILKADISIVTPNKKANSSNLNSFQKLKTLTTQKKVQFLYDANVGAGLPILSTVHGLMRSGDEIQKIEAILSGTLSYLFNSFDGTTAFSEIVQEAQKKGYTEPDPRDDLNGMDFARKILILARAQGMPFEMRDIDVKRFIPNECFDAPSVEAFYTKLKMHDATLSTLARKAQSEGKRLRYIGSLADGKATISLQAVGPEHPFYNLSGCDNIISITSKYYAKSPLVIRGPGAGADVTAARVLEGIVRSQQK